MINSKKLIPALAILITMTFTGITTQAMNESIAHSPNGTHPHVSINETIFTARKAKRQTMICRKCKKYSTYRYYDIQYFNHSFDKNKICTFCHYKKK